MTRAEEQDERVRRARDMRVDVVARDLAARAGIKLRRQGGELVGPCPGCGGHDRFAVNFAKNVWNCRRHGGGGDAIALIEHVEGVGFLEAVEILAGTAVAPPRTPPAAGEEPERDRDGYRRREIRRARELWDAAGPLTGSPAEKYLDWRGVAAPKFAKLRCHPDCPMWDRIDNRWQKIFSGPALIAAIADAGGRFQGVEIRWIHPGVATAAAGTSHNPACGRIPKNGRAGVVHPVTGEIVAAKKIRGSAKGGHIHLAGDTSAPCRRLYVGEGLETVLAVHAALAGLDQGDPLALDDATWFWGATGLNNLGGKALCQVLHPTEVRPDSLGRKRRLRVAGPEPLVKADEPALMPPESASEVVTLGDGDSDRFTAEQAHARAAARWARPGRTIRTAWAEDGGDFADMLTRPASRPASAPGLDPGAHAAPAESEGVMA